MRSAWLDDLFAVRELTGCGGIEQRLVGQRVPEPEREPGCHVIAVWAAAANLAVKESGRLENQEDNPLDGNFRVSWPP